MRFVDAEAGFLPPGPFTFFADIVIQRVERVLEKLRPEQRVGGRATTNYIPKELEYGQCIDHGCQGPHSEAIAFEKRAEMKGIQVDFGRATSDMVTAASRGPEATSRLACEEQVPGRREQTLWAW